MLLPDGLKVSRSFRKAVERTDYAVTLDLAFPEVVEACAGLRAQSRGTWLGSDMKRAYLELHRGGHCHSVEVWRSGELIGGLYGVAIGRSFFGESMFSRADNGSKIALYWLCRQLWAWQFALVDCQVSSPHLMSLGAVEMPREEFLRLQRPAAEQPGRIGRWRFDVGVPADARHLSRGAAT